MCCNLNMKREIIAFLFALLCSVTIHAQSSNESIVYLNGGGYLGYHDIFDKTFEGKDKVIPYLNASLNWIIRCGKHLEFALSPALFICPSEFDYSFVQLGGETDINPWLTNYFGLSLGLGYRF